MRSVVGLWRWRGNPLCRRTDRREAWLTFWAALLIVLGTPLVGWGAAEAAHEALLHTAQEQRDQRQRIWATVEHVTVLPPLDSEREAAAGAPNRNRVTAHWTGPDGSRHTGVLVLRHPVEAGSRFPVWADMHGRLTSRPMSVRSADSYSLLAGLAGAACTAGVLEAGRRTAVRLLLRRRYARWDEEWGRIGPDWGRTGTSS
ncbi:Rv1733c family protein [Streptomyces sp. 3N207]|uniref:Rv1733c family protein n=1 Tax=Streptomyces sp. 3N207 TaxID=3457417 RepID=UPI003FD50BDB